MKKFTLLIFVLFLVNSLAFSQGSTTSGVNGQVISAASNETLPGATVIALHTETGFQYATTTDNQGFFRLPNMNVGGPYKLTISFVGYNTFEQGDIYLTLGQTLKISPKLVEDIETLSEIVIAVNRYDNDIFDGNRTGAETVVNSEAITSLPSVARDLSDFTRLTPMASVTSNGGINIAGMSSRYNSIFIDGAVNNDVFGLADNGSNGGQVGISPLSIDAIEQFQVVVAPFDVRHGGFAGGGINAVTKSGTNKFKGTGYYFMRNENMAGKTPTNNESVDPEKLDPFTAKTYGVSLGGPIIENKLFFFVNAEIQDEQTPQPFDFADYNGDATQADIEALSAKLNGMGYNPGGFLNTSEELKGQKFLARFDYNLSEKHKLMFRHHYTKGESTSPSRSSSGSIRYANGGVYFPSTTNSTAIELKSYLSDKLSNKLLIGYTSVVDDRDPIGGDFPRVEISNGSGDIIFGSEEYSTANELRQKIFTVTNDLQLYKGKHTFTFGTHNEFYDIYNTFIRQNYGVYYYDDLSQFMTDQPATDYARSYSVVDDVTGDGTAAAADFKFMQLGFYAQDEIEVSDKLKVTAGLRVDIPIFNQQPDEDVNFNTVTIPLIEAEGYDMDGFKAGQMPTAQIMVAPRVGFNYDLNGDQTTQIRGGLGIFTSRIPFVWPGASYNNNGLMVGNTYQSNVVFQSDINNQYTSTDFDATATDVPSGDMNLFHEDFKFPQVFRTNIAVDQKLPWGMIGTFEAMYSKTLNNVHYYNYNMKHSTENLTGGPDNRPIYNRYDPVDGTYGYIMVGENTNEGFTYNLTAQLQKPFDNGLTASLAYTYGRAKAVNDGTSSQNSSQWRYMEQSGGRNFVDLTYSDFDMGSRIVGHVSYKFDYLDHGSTTISLFYNGQSGKRFSYTYNNYRLTNENSKDMDLIYIPDVQSDINLVDIMNDDGTVAVSAAQQWTDLDAFIDQDKYLSENRGGYSERNGARLPFTNIIDLRIAQDFYIEAGGRTHTLQLTFDVFNFTNMINKEWGRVYFANYYDNIRLIRFAGFEADGTTPTFTFERPDNDEPWDIDDAGINSSRWQAQFGVRYIF
jgi:outer membrane receptor for ferrienterochelin and colicin